MKKILILSFIFTSLLYAKEIEVKKYVVDSGNYKVGYDGKEQEFLTGINPGYGSGLTLKSINGDGSIEFYGVTDRGPNIDTPAYIVNGRKIPAKFFPTPNFNPGIGIIRVQDGKAQIVSRISLKNMGNELISGRVIPEGVVGATGEIGLDFAMHKIANDIDGLDIEGVTQDHDGNFWLCDEYGPFILKVDRSGKIIEKFGPREGLPKILEERVPNRGFEGITVDERGNVVAVMQSPLNINEKTLETAQYIRIIKLDPKTKKVKMYAYPIDKKYNKLSESKLGDITSIGNDQFLVIEQGKTDNKNIRNIIYKIDLKNADEILDNKDLEYGNLEGEVKTVEKKEILNMRDYGWNMEKAEGIVLLPDRKTIVVVNDNDFGITLKLTNSDGKEENEKEYFYDADRKEFYKNNHLVEKVNLGIKRNSENERESQIWFFKLNEEI